MSASLLSWDLPLCVIDDEVLKFTQALLCFICVPYKVQRRQQKVCFWGLKNRADQAIKQVTMKKNQLFPALLS